MLLPPPSSATMQRNVRGNLHPHAPPCRRVIVLFCFAGSTSIIEGGALTHRLDLLCGLRICILASLNAALRAMRLGQVVQICHTRWECAVVRPVFAKDHD